MKDITIEKMACAQEEMLECYNLEIAELKNKIETLESQNARLSVLPTATMRKEDPSIQEVRLNANQEAYYADLSGFRN